MKSLLLLLALALTAGCGSLLRTQTDEVHQYAPAGGHKVRGPRVSLGPLSVTLFSVDTRLTSAVEEPGVVVAATALSRAGLKDLAVSSRSERGATNTVKAIGYGAGELTTDVSTNAAPSLEAAGGAAGRLLHRAVAPSP